MEVHRTERGLRATGAEESVAVVVPDWTDGGGAGVPNDADAAVYGAATELGFAPARVRARRLDANATYELAPGDRTVRLPAGEYRVEVDGPLPVAVTFSGRGRLARDGDTVAVRFPERTAVTVGFHARERPRRTTGVSGASQRAEGTGGATGTDTGTGTVRVPPTAAGAAAALEAIGESFGTETPARSAPRTRGPVPEIEVREDATVDAAATEGADLTLRVPAELPYLFTGASLAAYLGAAVVPTPGTADDTPRIEVGGADGLVHELPRLPTFQRAANRLLRRVFLLDTLVREKPAVDGVVPERTIIDELGLDAVELAGTGLADRVVRYLDPEVPFERVSDRLPEWHLSMYVQPTVDRLETLPGLLADLPFVFLPEAEPLADEERLERSLDEFYRAGAHGTTPVVDAINPTLGPGRMHGWLADGVPIDVFKSVPEAYDRRSGAATAGPGGVGPDGPTDTDGESDSLRVVTVVNDPDMAAEYADLATGRTCPGGTTLDLTVRRRLTRYELAEVFAADTDLVHYVGHNERAGLRCADGHLSVADLPEVNADAFLLNACGSYYEGLDLVRKGSLAGAVTFNKVLDGHAARVGSTFVRLLVAGFSLERALDLARRRIMTGKDYAVVGDGTHRLTTAGVDGRPAADATLERTDDGRFRLTYRVDDARRFGAVDRPRFVPDDEPHLIGTERTVTLDRRDLVAALDRTDAPVVFEGDIHWSDELRARLEGPSAGSAERVDRVDADD
jgi:hypothetical protein